MFHPLGDYRFFYVALYVSFTADIYCCLLDMTPYTRSSIVGYTKDGGRKFIQNVGNNQWYHMLS
jgi:hypothetical protein